MFWAAKNLVSQAVEPTVPWEFKPTEILTAQIRLSKEDRQVWYQTASTQHNFYSGIEAYNNALRVSRDNPPLAMHAFPADYDVKIPMERVNEAIAAMERKPAWVETSLGGNRRLVWLLPKPLPVNDYDFCVFVIQEARKWLGVDLLPGLDEQAFLSVTRLYCNGCEWHNTGHGPLKESDVQAFFVKCGRNFRFKAPDDEQVPLEIISKELTKKYSAFNWPTDFELNSQGPSFWIPESTSPLSAVVKAGGMFTYAAHATKPFYPWSELISKDFVKDFCAQTITKATQDVLWDGKKFWKKFNGVYDALERPEMDNYLEVDCRLSKKPDSSGVSPYKAALAHIYNNGRIKSAGPFVFHPPGIIIYQNERRLNTYCGKAVSPAAGKQTWGPHGDLTFMCAVLDALYDPHDQLIRYLAWHKHYYEAAFYQIPHPGQNCFWMGIPGCGKTLVNRYFVGVSVGGFVDASDFLVDGAVFNSHLMAVPHWCLDDDSPMGSVQSLQRTNMLFKKLAANQSFLNNEKFQKSGMVDWGGRIGCTANLDFISSRIIGPLDNGALDKTNLFRCVRDKEKRFKFPSRREIEQRLHIEMPNFCRYLLDLEIPDFIERDTRYGYASYQEPSLLDQSVQSSPIAPFKEVLIESLHTWFNDHADAQYWTGTVTQLVKMIVSDPLNDYILRSVRLEQANRYLEQIQREGLIKSEVSTGPLKARIWKFFRE